MTMPALFPPGGASQPLFPRGWFLVELGGLPLPGKAEITGLGLQLKKDKKEKKGSNGGRPTYHGLEAQEGTIKVTVRTQEQLDELERVCALILPIPGSSFAAQPLSIASPQLVPLRCVTSVVVEGGSSLTRASNGEGEMTIKVSHWLPAQAGKTKGKQVTKTPADSTRNLRTEAGIVGRGTVLRTPNPVGTGSVLAPTEDASNWEPPAYGP